MTTLNDRKSELDTILGLDDYTSKVDGVTAAFDHEPANRGGLPPVFTTCVIGGMTPDAWQFVVRLYIDVTGDVVGAQRDLGTLMVAVDDAIAASSRFGPSNWTVEIDTVNTKAIIATNLLDAGREDF